MSMPSRRTKSNKTTETWKKLLGLIPVGIFVTLYLSRPYIETNRSPFITCAICDNQQEIRPPTSSHDYGAIITLTIDNTGSSATTIVEHNLSWLQVPETMSVPGGLSEDPDVNDKLDVPIGSRSSRNFQKSFNESLIYELRHPLPVGSSIGPRLRDKAYLYGHMTYKTFLFFRATTEFCFQYVPAYKGLPESWVVCTSDVHVNR